MTEELRFRGVYPMLYAFFDGAGRLDRGAMRAQVEYCVANGAHGIAALGLGTEVSKLEAEERRRVVEWVADDLRGGLPLAITVFGATPAEQTAFVQAAAARGADWVILQPPQTGQPITEDRLVDFFGAVADTAPVPVAIQNAPQYIGVGLSGAGLDRLNRDHPNVRLLKAEGSALETRALIEQTLGRMAVFQGRGGMEFIDVMRAGCVGMIPSVESCRVQSRIFELMQTGRAEDEAAAERLYAGAGSADHVPDAVGRPVPVLRQASDRRAPRHRRSPRPPARAGAHRLRPRLPHPPRCGAGPAALSQCSATLRCYEMPASISQLARNELHGSAGALPRFARAMPTHHRRRQKRVPSVRFDPIVPAVAAGVPQTAWSRAPLARSARRRYNSRGHQPSGGGAMLRVWGRNNSINVQKVMWAVGRARSRARADRRRRRVRRPGHAPSTAGSTPTAGCRRSRTASVVVWESNACVRYLAARYGAGTLWPEDPAERATADMWMDWQASTLLPDMTVVFWGLIRTPEDQRDGAAIEAAAQSPRADLADSR